MERSQEREISDSVGDGVHTRVTSRPVTCCVASTVQVSSYRKPRRDARLSVAHGAAPEFFTESKKKADTVSHLFAPFARVSAPGAPPRLLLQRERHDRSLDGERRDGG